MTYENSIKELNEITEKLSNSSVPLQESAKLFERAVELLKFCNNELSQVKGKITVLKDGIEQDFNKDE